MNSKQAIALALTVVICILWGLLAAESLGWFLILVWAFTVFRAKKNHSRTYLRFQAVDAAIALIGVSEMVLYFRSTYQANSIHFPLICLTFIFLWFYMRQWIVADKQKQLILGVLTAIGGALSIFTLFFFAFYRVKVTEMGFEDITQFRYLYRPMGMFSNDWASIMLAFLPFATASWFTLPKPYQRFSAVACLLISLSIIVSFSRGAIFCLVIFYLLVVIFLFYFRIYPFKRLALGCCLWFVILTLVCIPLRAPLLTTLSVTENISQVRSIEGRLHKWKDAGQLFMQYPATGVGAGNFTLRSEPLNNQRESTSTGRSTNSWFQLAAEKGLVGLFAYGLFFVVWMIEFIKTLRLRQKNHFTSIICGVGIFACLLRETTFSTLFDKSSYLLLFVLLLWFAGKSSRKMKIHLRWASFFLISIICFGVLQFRQQTAFRYNKAFIRTYEKGDADWKKLQKSLRLAPNNALLHANKGIYLLSQISGYDSLVFFNANIPSATAYEAKNAFARAVALNPDDASFQSNLGILQMATGDTVSAIQHLKQALTLAPHQSIYHMLCGLACSDDSVYSHSRFVHAVYYSPDILDSKWFSDLQAQDSSRAVSIVYEAQAMLTDRLANRGNDPLLQACLAKLLLFQGQAADAKILLHEVARTMPNLNRPWLMLGDIAAA